MKKSMSASLLLPIVCTAAGLAHAESERVTDLQLGVVALANTSIYRGADADGHIVPLILLESGGFYLRGLTAGYRFVETNGTSLAIEMEYGNDGYRPGDSSALNGMNKRRAGVQTGLALSHRLGSGQLEVKLQRTVNGTHGGYAASANYEHVVITTRNSVTSVYLGAEYHDARKSNYYFGVRESEATFDRPAYRQGAIGVASIGFNHVYRIGDRVSLIGSAGYSAFGGDIDRSPIVQRTRQVRAHAGFVYRI